MSYRRADIVTIALQGDLGKPRPALVVQANWAQQTETLIVALMTSDLHEAPLYRYSIDPTPGNGLQRASQVQIEKLVAVPLRRVGKAVGQVEPAQMADISRLMAAMIGLADA